MAICDTQAERLEQAQQLITDVAADYPGVATKPAVQHLHGATCSSQGPIHASGLGGAGQRPAPRPNCSPGGLHVHRKPMATRWADGVAMVKACDQASAFVCGKANRFNSAATGEEAAAGGALRAACDDIGERVLAAAAELLRPGQLARHLGV